MDSCEVCIAARKCRGTSSTRSVVASDSVPASQRSIRCSKCCLFEQSHIPCILPTSKRDREDDLGTSILLWARAYLVLSQASSWAMSSIFLIRRADTSQHCVPGVDKVKNLDTVSPNSITTFDFLRDTGSKPNVCLFAKKKYISYSLREDFTLYFPFPDLYKTKSTLTQE